MPVVYRGRTSDAALTMQRKQEAITLPKGLNTLSQCRSKAQP